MIQTVISALNEGFVQTLKLFVDACRLHTSGARDLLRLHEPLGALWASRVGNNFSQGEALLRQAENGENLSFKGRGLGGRRSAVPCGRSCGGL